MTTFPLGELPDLHKIQDIKQGTQEWHEQRMGLLTASRFGHLCQRGRGKDNEWGLTAWSYIYQCIAEKLGAGFEREFTPIACQWGNDFEDEAIAAYEKITGNTVERVGFIEYIPDLCGGSPDGLIGNDGVLEVKCPHNPLIHIKTLISGIVEDNTYMLQMQGYMMITGRIWCDFVSYDPRVSHEKLRCKIIRVPRNQDTIDMLEDRIGKAGRIIDDMYDKVMAGIQ